MFQFLIKIYNYIFQKTVEHLYPHPHPQPNVINLYRVLKNKHIQKYNYKYSRSNKYIYIENLTLYSIDYKKINDIYSLLQILSNGIHDIICISNIIDEIQTYNDGIKYVVTYTAHFIAHIMDMYYIVGANCIILSRIPIHSEKSYILDELYDNYIQRITLYVNETYINIYNVNIYPSVFNCLNYTNTFVANLLEDNYNKIPCIITGIINNSIYNWMLSILNNDNNTTNINTLLALNNKYSVTQFIYLNTQWCKQLIYIQMKTNDIYGISTIIKINNN